MNAFDHFAPWLVTPLGQYVVVAESAWFDGVAKDIFGYRAVQLELPQIDCLRMNRIPWRSTAGLSATVGVRCAVDQLPFDEQSIDLLALPHALDFADDPRAVLREAARVLRPEGRLLITGFNPWSLWGIRRMRSGVSGSTPWSGNAITLPRLKDWLVLLGLETIGGEFLCYGLPVQNECWLSRTRFLDRAGDRWWPVAGGVYCLMVVKRIKGMRLIEPSWKRLPVSRVKSAAVAEKTTVIRESE